MKTFADIKEHFLKQPPSGAVEVHERDLVNVCYTAKDVTVMDFNCIRAVIDGRVSEYFGRKVIVLYP